MYSLTHSRTHTLKHPLTHSFTSIHCSNNETNSATFETIEVKLKQEIVTDGREQVDAYMGLCTGLLCILDRLLQRKNLAFAMSLGTGTDSNIGIDAKNEHEQVW